MDELAERSGVSRNYVNKIEVGHSTRVSVTVFRALREALGLTAEDCDVIMDDRAEGVPEHGRPA